MDKHRISLDVSPKAKQEFVKLQKKTGSHTLVELFRNAMAVYELIVDHQKAGGKVILQDKAGEQEVLRLI